MDFVFYRDIFGSWRWEFRDAKGQFVDSQHGYETREECVEAANMAGLTAATLPGGAPPSHEAAILCIHADPTLRDPLQQALSQYQTSVASTSLEAIRLVNSLVYDAYVIDYWLPGSSGIHLCRHIRRSDSHTPICFFTRADTQAQLTRAFAAGASAYVCAAAGPEALRDELRTVLESAERQSTRAKEEGERAIQEELGKRVVVAIDRAESARALAAAATEQAARARAYERFVESGGTPAHFERWWPGMFAAASEHWASPSQAQSLTAKG